MSRVSDLLRRRRAVVLVALLLVSALVEGARSVGLPLALKQFVETAEIASPDRSALLVLALTYGALALSGIGTTAVLNALAETYAGMVADRMHAERLGVLLSSDMIDQPWDDAQRAVDSLDSSDEDVRRSLATVAGQVLPALVSLVGLYAVILLMDPLFLVALLLPLLLLAVVPPALGRVRAINAFDHARHVRALSLSHDIACARDDLRGVDSGDAMLGVLDDELTSQRTQADTLRRGALLAPLVVQLVGLITFVLCVSIAFLLLRSGDLTAGGLFGVVNAVFLIRAPLTTVAVNIRDLPHTVALLRRRPLPIIEEGAPRTLGNREPVLQIVAAQAGYGRDSRLVLRGVDVTVAAGACCLVTGRTGSGKSTLLKCIAGLLPLQAGTCMIGGLEVDVQRPIPEVAFVPQSPQLFSGDVRCNVTLYESSVTDEEVRSAIQLSGLSSWLAALPQGLDTPVNAAQVTPEVAQLLAVARAMATGPRVLLLDEPTDQLDRARADELLDILAGLCRRVTLVVASHDARLVRIADQHVEMVDGLLLARTTS